MKNSRRWQYMSDDGHKYVWCWDNESGNERRIECDIDGWIDPAVSEPHIELEVMVQKHGQIGFAQMYLGGDWQYRDDSIVSSVDYWQPLPRVKR